MNKEELKAENKKLLAEIEDLERRNHNQFETLQELKGDYRSALAEASYAAAELARAEKIMAGTFDLVGHAISLAAQTSDATELHDLLVAQAQLALTLTTFGVDVEWLPIEGAKLGDWFSDGSPVPADDYFEGDDDS